jgi:hypothetical protein
LHASIAFASSIRQQETTTIETNNASCLPKEPTSLENAPLEKQEDKHQEQG